MKERDRENWRAIDSGVRLATWADLLGEPDDAVYLSAGGAGLIPRMVGDLTEWFGEGWLGRAIAPDNAGRIASLARFSPTLSLGGDQGAAGAFIELVRWWAAIQSQATKPGMRQVRRDVRSDVTLTRLLHTLTQTRLGAIATSCGMEVGYEPSPGDLQISDGRTALIVEVFAMRTARDVDAKLQTSDAMFDLLDQLGSRYNVHFRGALPSLGSDLAEWRHRVAKDAATASRLNIALCISWTGRDLFVEPGEAPEGTSLDGPEIEGDVGARLRRRVQIKGRQIAGADAGWLWLENHGAVDMLVPIHSASLRDQLDAYLALFGGALVDVSSAKGLTFSGAGSRTWPPRSAEHSSEGLARALRQPLPLDRVRNSFHLPKVEGPESQIMWTVLENERSWLDHALGALGIGFTTLELIRDDLRVPA